MPDLFLILDVESRGDSLLWWGPNNCGYTVDFDKAGRYTREQIDGDRRYYDNREKTMAVPESAVIDAAVRIIPRTSRLMETLERAVSPAPSPSEPAKGVA